MSMHSFLSYTLKILNDVDIEIKKWNAAGNKYTLYEMEFSGRPDSPRHPQIQSKNHA